jgi:hypothetical protein
MWVSLVDMQKSIQPGKLTYVDNWYYYFGQRKLLKPPAMVLSSRFGYTFVYPIT